ncbi:ComEA family DNA-binding protein [Marinicrinis sediminis]|uniref:ComEA family DNA-binding protein n=1 Tax=Marinicrinis sediminis TaxID=1652465 RepID=A0ABW5RA47_9BACL
MRRIRSVPFSTVFYSLFLLMVLLIVWLMLHMQDHDTAGEQGWVPVNAELANSNSIEAESSEAGDETGAEAVQLTKEEQQAETLASGIMINEAGPDVLILLPGIGPAKAQRIVAYREANGPFQSPEDLLKVNGIGEKSLEKLRPYLRFSQDGEAADREE